MYKHLPKTILPSPDPKSNTFPVLPFNADKIFFICSFEAGTYGKQNFLSAGVTNGAQITVIPIAIPPENFQIY